MEQHTNTPTEQNKRKSWIKKIGFAGFMFFLIKGLVWLAALYFGFSLFD